MPRTSKADDSFHPYEFEDLEMVGFDVKLSGNLAAHLFSIGYNIGALHRDTIETLDRALCMMPTACRTIEEMMADPDELEAGTSWMEASMTPLGGLHPVLADMHVHMKVRFGISQEDDPILHATLVMSHSYYLSPLSH